MLWCAWGAQPWAREQSERVLDWVAWVAPPPDLLHIGRTKHGDPLHPLMQPYSRGLSFYDHIAARGKVK